MKPVLLLLFIVFASVLGDENQSTSVDVREMGRQLVEEGRTFVHHAVKRFMVILPAIFFKLGVAFTLLLLVTVVAVNNGFIGFLILVVGLSSVLARLQENRRPPPFPLVYSHPPVPYHAPPPIYHPPVPYHSPHAVYGAPHRYFQDRSDNFSTQKTTTKTPVYSQPYDYSQDLRYTDIVYSNNNHYQIDKKV